MNCRCFASVGVLALLAIPLGAQAPSPASKSATATKVPATTKAWTLPRTAWGDPDLQGIWTTETITPFERPAEFAGKEFFTKEEAAALEQRTAQNRVDRPPAEGDPGTYNQFWFDRGTRVLEDRRTSLIVDPPDGRIPWTPEARKRQTERAEQRNALVASRALHQSWVDLDTGERCLTDGLTMVPMQGYNMNFRIVQIPGYVVIAHEMFHDIRIIPTDGRPHVDQHIRQWLGDPRGRWEGNTLVIETTNFADKTGYWWAQNWRSSRPTLRLTERLTRLDPETIDYRFTIEDSTMFTRPWTASVPMSSNRTARGVTATNEIYEYACHEGNYAVANVLAGARAKEQEGSGSRAIP